ncbi:hypothetical protein ONS95_006865 [Cadophora gregata]|uniref:uncharacterized protein n=1 Tax=Cadophora gregata TaxID=51156 RepID=UPI0026DC1EF1|nr:uncharacterized protein ONS95_006865 [Cadophora gregata]KAK0101710.1 hypothetical protein ONS95_006865 [Cadophora gregata]
MMKDEVGQGKGKERAKEEILGGVETDREGGELELKKKKLMEMIEEMEKLEAEIAGLAVDKDM